MESEEKKVRAWQPLTAGGVAAFARAPLKRLLLVQFLFALLAAGAVVWFLDAAWSPTIHEAIRKLPARGEIRSGTLNWRGDTPQLLARGNFLSIAVDLEHTGAIRSPAHVQVEFGRNDIEFISVFGYADFQYPRDRVIDFNRNRLEPWWGAWSPPILWMILATIVILLMIVWALMAGLYAVPVWMVAFYANRELDLKGSWKLAGAALMPGSVLMSAAVVVYGLGFLDPVQLAAAQMTHLVVGWIYLAIAPFSLPRDPEAPPGGNPFKSSEH